MGEVRIAVRVRPGASRTRVGGAYGDPEATPLVVEVAESAVAVPPFELQPATNR